MNTKPTLLGIFAHPDDESFGPGGTFAKYAAQGAAVHVIIATDGIAGSVEDPSHLQAHDTLAQVRSAELSNAAVALGLTSIWSLPYRDSGMRGSPDNDHPGALIRQPLSGITDEMFEFMQRLQPQVVITHDPHGGYGHPDHIRVHEAATAAFLRLVAQRAGQDGRIPMKLYYTAFDTRMLKIMVRLMPLFGKDPTAFGRNKDINFVEIAQWDMPIHARIDIHDHLAAKSAASMAHASQYSGGPGYLRILPAPIRRRMVAYDTFTRAYPPPDGILEHDLFSGLH